VDSSVAEAALAQTVVAEAQTVERFVELLKLEQGSLSRGDTDSLPGHAEQKMKFAARLNELAAQRNAALACLGYAADRSGIEAWCAKHPAEEIAAKAWVSVIALAGEARELNRLNGELIRLRMQYNAKALEALRGGASSLDLYGPDGQATTPGRQRINHSV
jgi:flagella synthesis protein FlgN